MKLTGQEIKSKFTYNPDTGIVYKDGIETGSCFGHGYIYVRFGRDNKWLAHRLAWFLHYGQWPEGNLDHINRDKTDNRITNLRVVTQTENLLNHGNTLSGIYKHRNRWRVRVGRKGECGSFACFGEAIKARNNKVKDIVNAV